MALHETKGRLKPIFQVSDGLSAFIEKNTDIA